MLQGESNTSPQMDRLEQQNTALGEFA